MPKLSGGTKLEARLKELSSKVTKAAEVNVGFLENSSYPDGTPTALIAAVNEFGAPSRGIPSRPFFRTLIANKSGEWPDAVANLLVANDYDAAKTLGQTGEAIAGQLRQSIVDFVGAPLSEKTVAKKGGVTKQLVDSAHMLNSVSYEVD